MSITFQNPAMFGWLIAVGAVGVAGVLGTRWQERALRRLGRVPAERERRSRALRHWALVTALGFIVLALARPAWRLRTEPLASGSRDVVFVLDVSRSMLAQDCRPDRLGAARIAITDLANRLRPGDRVGLVVYAGSTLIVCPLTTDLAFFHKALEESGPTSVAYGGTRIGDALRKTADKLLGGADRRGLQDVILLTDGGDQGSEFDKAVAELNKHEAALLVIGLGSDAEGARIPEGDGFVVYRGREVWTRQESRGLEEIARAAAMGLYLNAGTRPIDLPDVYRRFTEHLGATGRVHSPTDRREEEFPWFLGIAVLLLIGHRRPSSRRRRSVAAAVAVALGASTASAAAPPAAAASAAAAAEGPNHAYEQAAARYVAAARLARDGRTEARNLYNAGTCWLQAAEQVEQAVESLRQAAKAADAAGQTNGSRPAEDVDVEGADTASMLEQSIQLYQTALERTPDFPEAARNLEIARARWRQAIAAQEKEQQSSESAENKPSDAMDNADSQSGDDTDQMNDNDADNQSADDSKSADSNQPSDTSLADLLNQNIPPPNVSPQDIIRRELENNQQRSAPSEPKAKAVEKNW